MVMKAYLEVEEVGKLEKAATNLRDRLLIRLLSHLGDCISEAMRIKVEDIHSIDEWRKRRKQNKDKFPKGT